MNFKKFLLIVLCFSLFLVTSTINVSAQDGQPTIFHKNITNASVSTPSFFLSTFLNSQDLHTSSPASLPQQLIIVQTSGNYNQQEVANMIGRISNIDSKTLYVLYNKNIRIKLINFPITYLPEYSYLRGRIPRGWEGTGYTWDSVPGIGGNPVVARIGYSNYGNMHTSINLELHETAHAIDSYVFRNISYSQEFLRVHSREYNSFSNSSYYYYPEEYFAEAYAYYYLNSSTHEILKTRAPYTYEFIQRLPLRL
ncbi:TPA: anthrax toxin lethal factor-related metalloendopeptidase [Bacillus cereus]